MIRPLVKFRKILYLPFKYWFIKYRHKKSWQLPTITMFYERIQKEKEYYLQAERKQDRDKKLFHAGALSVLKWVENYGKSNKKRND